MAFYQTNSHCSDDSLLLPIQPMLSSDTWTTLNLSNPIILTSTSLDRLSFTDSAPGFPPGHRPPLFTLMDIREERGMVGGRTQDTSQDQERTVITTPTAPRMKVLLEEKIVIKEWTAKVQPQAPPDHIPWNGLCPVASAEKRLQISVDAPSTNALGVTKLQPPDIWKTSRRNALVLDHESTYDVPKDVVGADASMVDHNRVYGLSLERPLALTGRADKRINFRHRSFYPIVPKRHTNLAIRRGHKAFPALKLHEVARKQRRDITSLDSIPTAFRGSPSTYSPILHSAYYPTCQGLALTEMLEALREKCASFSPKALLPADWFYRPRSPCLDMMTSIETASSKSQSSEDEWAFAEPLKGMVNTFSEQTESPDAHDLDLPNDYPRPRERLPPLPPARPCIIKPISPPSASRRARKTVRFADTLILPVSQKTGIDFPVIRTTPTPCASAPSTQPKHQSNTHATVVPPSPPISTVRSLQSVRPSKNSWTNNLLKCSLGLPPSPTQRPLSHRYPTSSKLPLFMEGSPITRTLSGSPLRQSYSYQPPSDIVGKSPPVQSSSVSARHFRKHSPAIKGRATHSNKTLRISHPMPIKANPVPKKPDAIQRGSSYSFANTKSPIRSPLRGIFLKFK